MAHVKEKLIPVDNLNNLNELVKDLKESVEYLSNQYDEPISKIKAMEGIHKTTQNSLQQLKAEIKKKDDIISVMIVRMRDTEQYSRNRNIEVSGLEVKRGEDLVAIMVNIGEKIGVPISNGDIDVIQRVPTRRGEGPPRVIAQFTTRKKRNIFLKNKNSNGILLSKEVVDGGLSDNRIYLNTHLTAEWKQPLWKTKQAGRPLGFKVIWYQDNRIVAKKDVTDTNPVYITTEADLRKFQ